MARRRMPYGFADLRDREYHVEFGRHSGIPDCCIEAFIDGTAWTRTGHGYAPCDPCLHKDPVAIHLCYSGCGIEWLREMRPGEAKNILKQNAIIRAEEDPQ